MSEEVRLVTLAADWLRPGAVVVGHLEIWMTGLRFRSLIPNPDRSIEVGVDRIERASAEGHRLGIHLRAGEPLHFLAANPSAVVLALDHALAIRRAATAYR